MPGHVSCAQPPLRFIPCSKVLLLAQRLSSFDTALASALATSSTAAQAHVYSLQTAAACAAFSTCCLLAPQLQRQRNDASRVATAAQLLFHAGVAAQQGCTAELRRGGAAGAAHTSLGPGVHDMLLVAICEAMSRFCILLASQPQVAAASAVTIAGAAQVAQWLAAVSQAVELIAISSTD